MPHHAPRTTPHARTTRSTTSRDREGAGMPRVTCKVLLCDTGRWRCHAGFAAGVGRAKLLLSRSASEQSGGGLGRSLALPWDAEIGENLGQG